MKKNNSVNSNKQLRILIVDSNQESCAKVAKTFLQHGLKTVIAGTGAEASDIIFWMRTPALVIIDMVLPDMSGLELATQIKRERAIPIVITGHQSEPHTIAGLLDLIADDFISKPYDARELVARAQRIIQSSIRANTPKNGEQADEHQYMLMNHKLAGWVQ